MGKSHLRIRINFRVLLASRMLYARHNASVFVHLLLNTLNAQTYVRIQFN